MLKKVQVVETFYIVCISFTLVLGPLRPEYTVKYGAVSIIFFISGLSLKTDSIYYTLRQHRLHLFIQGFTFIFIPIFTQLLIVALNLLGVDAWIIKGYKSLFNAKPFSTLIQISA